LNFSITPQNEQIQNQSQDKPRENESKQNEQNMSKPELKNFKPEQLLREYPPLAKGSYGTVYTGKVRDLGDTRVVIKDMQIVNYKSIQDWKNEIESMSRVRSRNIVEVFGYTCQGNILTIIMEYMSKGSLYEIIHVKHVPLTMIQRIRMARHCATGLSVLHSQSIMHRDIKSMNILVSDDLTCKITDFGCAKLLPNDFVFQTRNSGTPLWMAPEVRSGNYYGFPGDIYSLGLVLYEIFESRLPDFDQYRQIITMPQTYKFYSVIHPCLRLDPLKRPISTDLVKELNDAIHNIMTAVYEILPEDEKKKK